MGGCLYICLFLFTAKSGNKKNLKLGFSAKCFQVSWWAGQRAPKQGNTLLEIEMFEKKLRSWNLPDEKVLAFWTSFQFVTLQLFAISKENSIIQDIPNSRAADIQSVWYLSNWMLPSSSVMFSETNNGIRCCMSMIPFKAFKCITFLWQFTHLPLVLALFADDKESVLKRELGLYVCLKVSTSEGNLYFIYLLLKSIYLIE